MTQSASNDSSATLDETSEEDLTENDRRRLELYHKSFDDQRVDIGLIMSLLRQICMKEHLEGIFIIRIYY